VPIDIGHYDSSGCFECGCLSASCTEPDSSHLNANGAGDKFATFGPWLFDIKPHEQQASKKPAIGTDSSSSSSSPTDARMTAAGLHKCGGEWVRYGVAFHRACGQVLQQRLGYAIDFNHIWPLLEQQNEELPDSGCVNYFISISYDGTDKYHGQEFEPWLDTEDEYLLLDPRHCRQNADRIVRVWEPLVQKFRGHQPGTAAAAAQAGSAAPAVQASAASLEVSKVGACGSLHSRQVPICLQAAGVRKWFHTVWQWLPMPAVDRSRGCADMSDLLSDLAPVSCLDGASHLGLLTRNNDGDIDKLMDLVGGL